MLNTDSNVPVKTDESSVPQQPSCEVLKMHQEMLSRALRHYWSNLKNSIKARRYIKSRGLEASSIERFGLGYADSASQGLRTVFPNYHVPALVDCGLVKENGNKRYDRFRDRLIFPILNDEGRVIAFGGRIFEGEGPKYLNSPQTALFDKGSTLFGFPQAKASIGQSGQVIVVEGYMDVVMSAQYGIENIVATLGTATTSSHIEKLILSGVREIVFCFDGDDAGRKAAEKALFAALAKVHTASIKVSFAFLPSGEDPDSFIRANGAEAFREFVGKSSPLEEYLLKILRDGKDLDSSEGKANLTCEALNYLAMIQDAAMFYRLCEQIACDTQFSVAELINFVGETQRTWFPESVEGVQTIPPTVVEVDASTKVA